MSKKIRNNIIKVAESCIDKPFHHQAYGPDFFDCIGLVKYVMRKNNLFDENLDIKNYGREPDGKFIAKIMSENFDITTIDNAKSGDIILFKFINNPQHFSFLKIESDGSKSMIHAYGDPSINRVVKHNLDDKWINRIVCIYKIRGLK